MKLDFVILGTVLPENKKHNRGQCFILQQACLRLFCLLCNILNYIVQINGTRIDKLMIAIKGPEEINFVSH